MGLDLDLFPIAYEHTSFDKLHLDRKRELFDQIMVLNFVRIDKAAGYFCSDFEDCTENPYGDKLVKVKVKDLLTLTDYIMNNDSYINKAVWSYLAMLPEDNEIILYWH